MKVLFIPLFFIWLIFLLSSCKKMGEAYPSRHPKAKRWVVSTMAGDGSPGYRDGAALQAHFHAPQDVAIAPDGSIFVADALNHRIRKIKGGTVMTFAGHTLQDTLSGTGTEAGFSMPFKLLADPSGNLFTIEVNHYRVRSIAPDGRVRVLAGNGIRGFIDGSGSSAMFGESVGIARDSLGNIYVSDWENRRIRQIRPDGEVSTFFGPSLFRPGAMAIDKLNNVFVIDGANFQILKIAADGTTSVFAGSGVDGYKDGSAAEARFSQLMNDLVTDEANNLYLADGTRIRKISPEGQVSTIAGNGWGYEDGEGSEAKFSTITGLGMDKQGNIYATDNGNERIRKISFE
jgi:hypothetical protein